MSPSSAPFDLEAQPEKVTQFAHHVTLEPEELDRPHRHATGIEMVPRLTSEFRTLSIHVETRTSPVDADTVPTRKNAIKGTAMRLFMMIVCLRFSQNWLLWIGTSSVPMRLFSGSVSRQKLVWITLRSSAVSNSMARTQSLHRRAICCGRSWNGF